MPIATYPAMFFTVALLVTTAYFLMGGLPLLILKHDTPLDGRFVRGFFNVYFLAATGTAAGTALSYAFMPRLAFALGAAAIAVGAMLLRRRVLPVMDHLRARIVEGDDAAVVRFRRIHMALLAGNVAQLVLLVWSLMQLKL